MLDVVLDALLDTLKVFPFVLIIYVIIELLEHKTDIMGTNSRLNGKLGPLLGSATGLIPQCGFSVMAAKLFEQNFISVGTLLAIFLSTSDEAFIMLLGDPTGKGAKYLLPFIISKIVIGVIVGYSADLILKGAKKKQEESEIKVDTHSLFMKKEQEQFGCTSCGKEHDGKKPVVTYFVTPLLHTLKVIAYVLAVNLILGTIIYFVTEEKFIEFMEKGLYVQPFITSLIGLIPNCASSVVLTQCFLDGGIAFGSCVAGLCMNAGLGFMILLKNRAKWKRNIILILVCYLVSVVFGLGINAVVSLF